MRISRFVSTLMLLMFLGAVPAAAVGPGDVSVTDITGRSVTFSVVLPEDAGFDADSKTEATVEVAGQLLPAVAEIDEPEAVQRSLVLVIDASGSMKGAPIREARAAVESYLATIPPDVAVGLVTFADEPDDAASLGSAKADVVKVLQRLSPSGETSLYDAVLLGLQMFPGGSQGRLVVVTDGADTSSSGTLGGVTRTAESRGVPIDVVLLAPTDEHLKTAEQLAVQGAVATATGAQELTSAFATASQVWAPSASVVAQIPASVDAAGATAVVVIAQGGTEVVGEVGLPPAASLRAAASADANPPVPPAVETNTASVPPGTSSPDESAWIPRALIGAVAAAVVLGIALSVRAVRHGRSRQQRIAQVLSYGAGVRTSGIGSGNTAVGSSGWTAMGHRLDESALGTRLRGRLAAAEMAVAPATWVVVQAMVTIGAAALLWAVLGRLWLAAVMAVILVPLLFAVTLRFRVGRRQRAFSDELPEFLLLLASALRAGLSFTQSLESAADQHRGQVGRQIRRALAEAQVGATLDQALLNCADRMGNDDLRWTVTALSVQREVGGNLSTILDNAAATIKGRRALAREVRTLSAEGRLSAYVLIALPVGVLIFLMLFRYEYVSALWTHPLGIAMMIALVVLLVIGWVWMRAIVRIRV